MRKRLAAVLGIILVMGACSSKKVDIGKAAEPAAATRTVEIKQLDTRKFDPAQVEAKAGETVTFRITNTATSLHEFFLADKKAQEAHEQEMAAMGDAEMKMSDTEARLFLEPGETKEITWNFPAKAEVPFGCHMPGHFQGGMQGVVKVA